MVSNENNSIRVEVDLELIPVVPDYLENRRLDSFLIERLLIDGQMSEIRSLGHRMKGSGGSYGFDEISEIGEKLELGALLSDAEGIRAAVMQLRNYLSRVTVAYV